jgi:GT2 family glycosyltransferase
VLTSTDHPDISVLIPTRGRPEQLRACLESLANQHDAPAFEVLVGVDDAANQPGPKVPPRLAEAGRLIDFGDVGYISIRRRLLREARAPIALSLNDDVVCDEHLLRRHAEAHAASSRPALVAGRAPWAPVEHPTLFDGMVQTTAMVFLPPEHATSADPLATTFRHCFGLNLSAPTAFALEAGGFPDLKQTYGYDDIELAFRLRDHGAALLHAPHAIVTHHHRMTPRDLHRREYLLGRSAVRYAAFNPAFVLNVFGRDVRTDAEHAYAEQSLQHERRDAERAERHLLAFADHPVESASADLLCTLADAWLPLKRYLWRWGAHDERAGVEHRWSLLSEAPALP